MFYNRLPAAVVFGALVLVPAAAVAQDELSGGDKEWMEEEVGALITEEEKALFQAIDEDDRDLFKELFWKRRDFNPMTSDNEFKEEYERRVDYVDDNFKVRGRDGSQTDMGRLFLLLGPPSEQQQGGGGGADFPSSPTRGGTGEEPGGPGEPGEPGGRPGLGGGSGGDARMVTWIYEPRPELGLPDGLEVRFRQQPPFGYRMMSEEDVMEKIERAKQRLITNPGVNYARDEDGRLREPDQRFDPNSPAKKALETLTTTGETTSDIAFTVNPIFFRSSAGQVYIPMDVVVQEGLEEGEKAIIFGEVQNADGFPVYRFEEEAEVEEDKKDHLAYEMPLQLQPGLYTLYMGLLDQDEQLQGTKILDLEVPDFDTGELKLSSILMFTEGERTGEAMGAPGKAFLLGGYHFTPKRELVYTQEDQLSGVFNAYNFGVEGDKPKLTMQVLFFKGEQKRGQTKDEPFMLQTPEMALTIFDIPLNLPNFQDPGEYRVQIKVTDHVKGETLTKEIPFEMVSSESE